METVKVRSEVEEALAACRRCNGVGIYYDPDVEVGRYGELKLCTCVVNLCRCNGRPPYHYWDENDDPQWCPLRRLRRRLETTKGLFKECAVPERFKWKFNDEFNATTPAGQPIAHAERCLGCVSSLIDSGIEPRHGFLLHGPPGTGKTLLACIMLNELLLHRTRPGRFLAVSRFLQRLRDTFSEESQDYGQTWPVIEEMATVPYLVLDDLGTQRNTEWEKEQLYNLIDARYSEERLTIVTTNYPLEEIKEIAEGRIYSRLMEMCKRVEMGGDDYRQLMQQRY